MKYYIDYKKLDEIEKGLRMLSNETLVPSITMDILYKFVEIIAMSNVSCDLSDEKYSIAKETLIKYEILKKMETD